jgi:hypothetical protein
MKHAALVLAALVVLGSVGQAKADMIYNNLSSNTYSPSAGYTISGPTSGVGIHSHTESFVAGRTANLSDISLAIWHKSGSTDFILTLTNSSSNILESWKASAPDITGSTHVVVVNSVVHPLLEQGQTYFLAATAGGNTWDDWELVPRTNTPTNTPTLAMQSFVLRAPLSQVAAAAASLPQSPNQPPSHWSASASQAWSGTLGDGGK